MRSTSIAIVLSALVFAGCKYTPETKQNGENNPSTGRVFVSSSDKKASGAKQNTVVLALDPQDQMIEAGRSASFSVIVDDPSSDLANDYDYQWMKNGKKLIDGIIPNLRIGGIKSPTLTISAVVDGDVGWYACQVTGKNNSGKDRNAVISDSAGLYIVKPDQTLLGSAPHITSTTVPVSGPLNPVSGTAGTCPGAYTGKVTYLTSTGSQWFTPPSASTTNLTVTVPYSGTFSRNYKVAVEIVQSTTLKRSCGSEPSTPNADFIYKFTTGNPFDVTKRYCITVYIVGGTTLPSSGTPIPATLTWSP